MTAPPIAALAKTCEVRPGEARDAVQGVTPAYVAAPATVAEASELMRAAAERELTVVPRGAGTKLHWGAPPERCDLVVETRRLGRLVEHAAGDLVVKAEAGLPLDELQEVLAGTRQQLALDGLVGGATIGGVIAAATAGPRRLLYGSARDLLIGITVIRADGVVAHAGGKVVKNVAGYDLGKLFAGSRGTLGLITEAAFRLHPLPQASAYVTARASDGAEALAFTRAILRSPLVPSAIEVDGPGPLTVTVLLEGFAEAVPARAEAARALIGGDVGDEPPPWWGRLPEGEVLAEVRTAPSKLAAIVTDLTEAGTAGTGTTGIGPGTAQTGTGAGTAAIGTGTAGTARIRGSAGRGVWHVGLPAGGAEEMLARLRRHGTAVVLAAPDGARLDRWGPLPALSLMRRVKDQFDPGHRLSPGRFAGGI